MPTDATTSHPSGPDPFEVHGDVDAPIGAGCQDMVARLYYFLDGELNDTRRATIQHHLDGCPSCFSAFDFEAELRIVVQKRVHTRVPAELAERIRVALHSSALDPSG